MTTKNAVYIEVWFDSEDSRTWKLTEWWIDDIDFDPFTTEYSVMDYTFLTSHEAIAFRRGVRHAYQQQGVKVYTNEWNPKCTFNIVQSWVADMLNPVLK